MNSHPILAHSETADVLDPNIPSSSSSSVLSWLDDVENSSPSSWEKSKKRSRKPQASDDQPPPKRIATRHREPLLETSHNKMHPTADPEKTPQPNRRRSPRKQQQDPSSTILAQATGPTASPQHRQVPNEEDQTPRPRPPQYRLCSTPNLSSSNYQAQPPEQPDDDTVSSRSGSSMFSDDSSTRSKSPIKSFFDLQWAERPTDYKNLDGYTAEKVKGVLEKCPRLSEISMGIRVIPSSLKSFIEERLHKADYPPAHAYIMTPDTASHDSQLYETKIVKQAFKILQAASNCDKERLPEDTWNSEVHEVLFKLVTQQPKFQGAVEMTKITTARIQPKSLAMKHTSGTQMRSKLVDYCINLLPCSALQDRIEEHLRPLPASSQSINQTMFGRLRKRPIAINIETKKPFIGGEAADIQMATWEGAGLGRMRLILDEGEPQGEGKWVRIPALPALIVYGHDLYFLAFEEQEKRNVMYGKLRLGGSDTLMGVFQMFAALDVLVEWADKEYRDWFTEVALSKPGYKRP